MEEADILKCNSCGGTNLVVDPHKHYQDATDDDGTFYCCLDCRVKKPVFSQYEHHGCNVWVKQCLKGIHRHYCLCHVCEKFKPGEEANCPIAKEVYANCVKFNLVTPVWECPNFEEKVKDKRNV